MGAILVLIGILAGGASLFVKSTHSFQDKEIEWNFIRSTIRYLKITSPIPHLLHVIVYGSYFLLACLFTQLNLIPLGYQELNISDAELAERKKGWQPPAPRYTRGVQAKFAFNASSASKGAVLDAY